MCLETLPRTTLTLSRISGRWMDAMSIEGHATHDTLTQMCIGCMTKTFNALDALSTVARTMEIFACFGFRIRSLELFCKKKDGKSRVICGVVFLDTRLNDSSTKGGQRPSRFWSSVSMVPLEC